MGHDAAVIGGAFGGVLGLAIVATYGMIVLARARNRAERWMRRPTCRNGTCVAWEYVVIGPSADGEGTIDQCRCGDRYLNTGDRFMLLLPDGTAEPYMVRPDKGRDWAPDPRAQGHVPDENSLTDAHRHGDRSDG
jgi:hypothetical protein